MPLPSLRTSSQFLDQKAEHGHLVVCVVDGPVPNSFWITLGFNHVQDLLS